MDYAAGTPIGVQLFFDQVDLFDFQICFEFRLKVTPGICVLFDQRRPVIGQLLLTLIQKMTQQLMWHVYFLLDVSCVYLLFHFLEVKLQEDKGERLVKGR